MSLFASLVADFIHHNAKKQRLDAMPPGQRSAYENGQRLRAEIAEFICHQPDPITAKRIALEFGVTVECVRVHALALRKSGAISVVDGIPKLYWRAEH
jgi:hypothetical protein